MDTTTHPDTPDKYKVFIVEDNEVLRELLVECARLNGFEAEGYEEAERVVQEIFFDPFNQNIPDLCIIDLELNKGRMQGMELIKQLTDRNMPAAIIAVSGNLPISSLLEAMKSGAMAALPKPFDQDQLLKKMRLLAEIGRKRRLHKQEEASSTDFDSSREYRPVFLSYSAEDRVLARVLKSYMEDRGIRVWYASDTLQPGDIWRSRVESAIDQVNVFIALITEKYSKSHFCMGEMTRFHERLKTEPERQLLMLPILDCSLEGLAKPEWLRPIIEKYHCIDISDRFVDGLTSLLVSIQRVVSQHQ